MSRLLSSPGRVLLVLGVILISLNLRPAIAAVAPLAERIHADGLSRSLIGSFTTVPLILFGVAGLFAGIFGNRIGFARALGIGLAFIALGSGLRWISPFPITLMIGSGLIGLGIAIGNVLLPGLVKARFPDHIGLVTSLYSTAIGMGAASAVGSAVFLSDALPGGWQAGLGVWIIPASIALLLWIPEMRLTPKRRPSVPISQVLRRLASHRIAWSVAFHMGFLSMLFFSTIVWLPSILQARGLSETSAASLVSTLQIVGAIASLTVPRYAGKMARQSWFILVSNALVFLSIAAIWYLPESFITVSAIILGLGLNASFGLCLLVISLRSADARTTSQLSAGAQAFGYLISAPGPWLIGSLKSSTGDWHVPVWMLVAFGIATAISGWLAGRDQTIDLENVA